MFKKDFGFFALVAMVLFSIPALAQRVEIFDVRRNLQMTPNEPVFKDYYLTAGKDAGIKEGMIISVTRAVPVFDHSRGISHGEMQIRVGQLRVLYVSERMSVARVYKNVSRDEVPVAEIEGFMIGDRLDLGGAYMDKGSSGDAPAAEDAGEPAKTSAQDAPKRDAGLDAPKRDVAQASPIKAKAERMPQPKSSPSPKQASGEEHPPQLVGEIPGMSPEAVAR